MLEHHEKAPRQHHKMLAQSNYMFWLLCVAKCKFAQFFAVHEKKVQRTRNKSMPDAWVVAAKRSKSHCAQYQSPFYRYTRETRNLNLFMSLAINFTTLTRRILMQLEVWYDAMEKRVICCIGNVWSNFPSRRALSSLSKPQHTDSCHFFSFPRILPSICGDGERKRENKNSNQFLHRTKLMSWLLNEMFYWN